MADMFTFLSSQPFNEQPFCFHPSYKQFSLLQLLHLVIWQTPLPLSCAIYRVHVFPIVFFLALHSNAVTNQFMPHCRFEVLTFPALVMLLMKTHGTFGETGVASVSNSTHTCYCYIQCAEDPKSFL